EAEVRELDLRQRDRDQLLAAPPDQLAPGEVPLEVLLDLAADDVLEPAPIALDTPDHTASTTAPAPSSTPAMVVSPRPSTPRPGPGRGRPAPPPPARRGQGIQPHPANTLARFSPAFPPPPPGRRGWGAATCGSPSRRRARRCSPRSSARPSRRRR